ncbi:GPCR protein, PTH11-type [Xylariaceae sp. FL1272]|nr:GPCR protein, PTH11-type [Xylariaceae sp. FL1272]
MTLYSPPPPLHTFYQDKPTLLVCWWMTLFCATVILLRVTGRFIRSEKLFKEDRTVLYALVPLFARMGLVHLVLLWGTNNARFDRPLSEKERMHKAVASGLVIATRMLYAATLWILKLAVLDFFKRLTSTFWKRSHEVTLKIIRVALGLTFFAILAADLTECRPFDHYWQVLPDPGGECRQGYVQLITMSVANIMTDLTLVLYPVPIILTSQMGPKRKFQLTLLFAMSLGPVGTTIFRLVHVLRSNGSQQTRSLLASVELLFATTAANALVLGSFVRDRGTKKAKYRADSFAADTLDRVSSRRPTIRHWGSDEDLVRELGVSAAPEYRDEEDEEATLARRVPAPPANVGQWQLSSNSHAIEAQETTAFLQPIATNYNSSLITPRRVSFADARGLLDGDASSTLRSNRDSYNSSQDPLSPYRSTPSPIMTASGNGLRRGSQTILHDLGGLFHPFQSRRGRGRGQSRSAANATELQPIAQHPHEPAYETASYRGGPILVDAGGLLK